VLSLYVYVYIYIVFIRIIRTQVLKEGWLLKQSKKLKKWQKRYLMFVVLNKRHALLLRLSRQCAKLNTKLNTKLGTLCWIT
jgi:hypothetical protein